MSVLLPVVSNPSVSFPAGNGNVLRGVSAPTPAPPAHTRSQALLLMGRGRPRDRRPLWMFLAGLWDVAGLLGAAQTHWGRYLESWGFSLPLPPPRRSRLVCQPERERVLQCHVPGHRPSGEVTATASRAPAAHSSLERAEFGPGRPPRGTG